MKFCEVPPNLIGGEEAHETRIIHEAPWLAPNCAAQLASKSWTEGARDWTDVCCATLYAFAEHDSMAEDKYF